jgi:FkbM family methyltransferase
MKTKYKILIAKIISKFLLIFISKNQIVYRNNIKWNLDLEEAIDLSIYLFGTFERKISNIKKLLSGKKHSLTIIDIGANIGSVSLLLAKSFENSKIFAIEPTNYAYNKLLNNLNLNNKLNNKVFLKQFFITNKKKPLKVWSSWNFNKSDSKHQKHLGDLKEIKQNSYLSLNQFIKDEGLESIDFIKIDVDGYELDVLLSGEEFLRNNKPIIFIEIAPYLYPEFGYSCLELIKFIQKLGYTFLDENTKEVSDIFDQIDKIKDGGSENFFLV